MDSFILSIDPNVFRATNAVWNALMLNDPWSVGYVSSLIESRNWKSKEEWEEFYYQSGKERKTQLGGNAYILEDFSLIRTNPNTIQSLTWTIRNLNTQFGRTKEDLLKKAEVLKDHLQKQGLNLSLDEAFECVRFRTICETWNGIIIREQNTIAHLGQLLPTLSFKKTDGDKDHTFAVDYEVFCGNKLICAIQIKPKTYLSKAPYIQKARYANYRKYEAYHEKFGVPVLEVISTSRGEIINSEVVNKIKTMC